MGERPSRKRRQLLPLRRLGFGDGKRLKGRRNSAVPADTGVAAFRVFVYFRQQLAGAPLGP
jgi:hypothetical protein